MRNLKFRVNKDNFWMQHVIGDTLLNMFCCWFFGWVFFCGRQALKREKLNVHPLTEVTLEQGESEPAC